MEHDLEKQENTEKKEEQSENITQSESQPIEQLICPKCGGSRIRKRRILTSFPVIIALFFIFLLLLEFVSLLQFAKSGPVIGFILMLSLCTLFIAVWLGIVEIRRCRSCGHRFHRSDIAGDKESQIPFPWIFVLLNGIIVFIVCIASREIIRFFLNGSFSFLKYYTCIECISAFQSSGVLLALSLPYQAVLYFLLRKKLKNNFFWAILFIVPAIALGTNSLFHTLPKVRALRILSYGRLASLPKSARDVREYSWSSLVAGEWFLRFNAGPEDIETFINNSESIKGRDYEIYSSEKMRLPHPMDIKKSIEYQKAGHVLYFPDATTPDWYIQKIDSKAREYKIPDKDKHNWGEVIVDDVNDVVYIKVIWN